MKHFPMPGDIYYSVYHKEEIVIITCPWTSTHHPQAGTVYFYFKKDSNDKTSDNLRTFMGQNSPIMGKDYYHTLVKIHPKNLINEQFNKFLARESDGL